MTYRVGDILILKDSRYIYGYWKDKGDNPSRGSRFKKGEVFKIQITNPMNTFVVISCGGDNEFISYLGVAELDMVFDRSLPFKISRRLLL